MMRRLPKPAKPPSIWRRLGSVVMRRDDKRYKTAKGGFEHMGLEEFTVAQAFEMALISRADKEMMFGGITLTPGEEKTPDGVPWVAVAIELINQHYPDEQKLRVLNAKTIRVTDAHINACLDYFEQANIVTKLRDVPSFNKKGVRF